MSGCACCFTGTVFSMVLEFCIYVCKPLQDVCTYCTVCVCATYIIIKELHNKGGHTAVNADEEVDAGQHHVGCAGHAEDEGGGVHHGGDGPPADTRTPSHSSPDQI